jgi:hypothetical protein
MPKRTLTEEERRFAALTQVREILEDGGYKLAFSKLIGMNKTKGRIRHDLWLATGPIIVQSIETEQGKVVGCEVFTPVCESPNLKDMVTALDAFVTAQAKGKS